jgi:hypothetical protein
MRTALSATAAFLAGFGALMVAAPAYAGGLGIIGTVGARQDEVAFYSSADTETFGGDGDPIVYDDINDYERFSITQNRPFWGGGLELLLGDRDDMIQGSFRFYYQQDSPQLDPASLTSLVDPDYVVAAYQEDPRHVGVGVIGLNIGLVEVASDRLRIGAAAHIGAGFVTLDHTEYFLGSVGPEVTYKAARQVHIFADIVYQGRVRQVVTHSGGMYVGARYFFD